MASISTDGELALDKYPSVKRQFEFVLMSLRRKEIAGAHPCAKATIEVLRSMLSNCGFKSVSHMIGSVKAMGKELMAVVPCELTIGNVVRRVLYLIREEYNATGNGESDSGDNDKNMTIQPMLSRSSSGVTGSSDSLADLLARSSSLSDYSGGFSPELMKSVTSAVNELYDEIDNVYQPICDQAQDHVHHDECILTIGYSGLVEKFLKAAAKKRRFQVIIAESAPSLDGHKLATALSKTSNISVTLIPDSNIYAITARVNKVVISPISVMADGGAICASGHLMVAVAAKEYKVPVIGVTTAFMLTPLFSHNQQNVLNQLLSPKDVIPYDAPLDLERIEITIPAYDFVPPDMCNLYVTNNGSHLPSYMYRLLGEYYHPNDHEL